MFPTRLSAEGVVRVAWKLQAMCPDFACVSTRRVSEEGMSEWVNERVK